MSKPELSPRSMSSKPTVLRIAGLLALFTVLGLAFVGYLTPDMRVQWANFVALCGF